MAIDNLNANTAANAGVHRGLNGSSVTRSDRQQSPAAPAASQEGSVSISQEASRLANLEAEINASPDVNQERVEEIKRAIADGSYRVDAEQIAGKLLDQDDFFA
ncbi:flagellar biosynthesis anti-sigma factor FlgM [Halioxenophilus sp. WMMB6]|uniref:flagellar biosynthesis anti-sigma factor FlgM n=1 Tax=Halioxenophilus sp. WMMB6 TaxID=3073815 RepID=UPI00295EB9B8|nr:flagellar biosynthesis anti-sigma factor FlgM [Halioxenophilus sp. WMMB6]